MIPNVLMFVQPFDEVAWQQKMKNGITVTTVVDERWHRCDIKSVNLLGNCMAATTAKVRGFDEAVLVDERGIVSEGTHATFLWAKNHIVYATPLSNRILPGITRQKIADICKSEGIKFSEAYLPAAELPSIEEAFLCGTTTEVLPIIRIDSLKVGNGMPGALALRLQKAYRKQISLKITNDLN
jgi:D-alanine transaminase